MSTQETNEPNASEPSAVMGPYLDTSDELGGALRAFGDLDAQASYVRSLVASSLGIGTTDVRALVFLAQVGDVTPKQVAEKVGLSTGAITNMVDRMVAADLVARVPHPRDRRSLLLRLAPAGEQAVSRLADFYRNAFGEAVEQGQLALLTELFNAIRESLERNSSREVGAQDQPVGEEYGPLRSVR